MITINERKSLLSILLLIFMVAMLTGCFGSGVDNTVWETYEGENFVLSYPGEDWHIITEEKMDTSTFYLSIGNAKNEEEAKQILNFYGTGSKITNDKEWEEEKSNISYFFEGEKSEITVDGFKAYKIHASGPVELEETSKDITMDFVFIWVEDYDTIYSFMYGGIDDNYNSELSEKMLNKLKIK